MSANAQSFEHALKIIQAAKDSGADAIKLQTYTADTLTMQSDNSEFKIGSGSPWSGQSLYALYAKAHMPWDWQPKLQDFSKKIGLPLFSSPFDISAVEFLEKMNIPAYKIASFEIVDIPLIERAAKTGKPLIISTGMASIDDIALAVKCARGAGATEIALLKCTSAYPAPEEEMNLRTLNDLSKRFNVQVGLSDHTIGFIAPVVAASLGATIIEKHFTLSRSNPSPDSSFSIEPDEFKQMVAAVRSAEKCLGKISYEVTDSQKDNLAHRRSLFVVEDIKKGEPFTNKNIRSIRPGNGLAPKYLRDALDQTAAVDVKRGTPLSWELFSKKKSTK